MSPTRSMLPGSLSCSRWGMYWSSGCIALLLAGLPTSAHAGGFEDTMGGAVGLGRAASVARGRDFMATWQNPANLAVVPGIDIGLELRVTAFDACFDRVAVEGVDYRVPGRYEGDQFNGTETFQNVCNTAGMAPSGNLGWAQALPGGWGLGAGLFTPAGVGGLKFGDDTVVTWPPYLEQERFPITREGAESPTRQMLIDQESAAAWLAVGAGYQPIPELRVGLGLAAGFAYWRTTSVASVLGGTFRDPEYLSEVTGTDWFVPRGILSVVATPLPALELFGILVYQADVRAKGDVTFESNGIKGAPLLNCRDDNPGPHCGVQDATSIVPFPRWEGTLGARYAQRRSSATPNGDPMRDELWDVELDATLTGTSHVKEFTVDLYEGDAGAHPPKLATSSIPGAAVYALGRTSSVPKQWKDTVGLRLGADFNVVPARLALRGGLSYSSSAVPLEYMNIDVWAVRKIGLHLGATLAFGKTKLSVGYAHLFYESVQVAPGEGGINDVVAALPEQAQAVNEGDYAASQDVLSLQANYTF